MAIFTGRINKIFTAVCEEVLFTCLRSAGGGHLSGINIHTVLSLLGELYGERDNVPAHMLCHVLAQLLLLHPVLVQGGHEVSQRPRHLELDLKCLGREN